MLVEISVIEHKFALYILKRKSTHYTDVYADDI